MAPLVDLKAFYHLVRKQENRNYLQLRCRCLFPTPTESSDEDPNSLPKGILQLHHMLHSEDPAFLDEMYFKENDDSGNKSDLQYLVAEPKASDEEQLEQKPDKNEVGALIGSGGFGIAFEARWNKDYVVKASHFGEMKSIQQEIKALHRLTHGNGDCHHVPKIQSYGTLEYDIRNIKTTTPAFVISPRAMPLDMKTITLSDCKNIFRDIKKALEFIHRNNVFHLDVSPRNIMRKSKSKNGASTTESIYILIDFGCAIVSPAKATGCQGTLAFTHKEIHEKENTQTWDPKQKYDRASLAFTMAAFGSKTVIPWHGFNKRVKGDKEVFKERRNVAKKIFKDAKFTNNEKTLLANFVRGA
eukprot:409714_1